MELLSTSCDDQVKVFFSPTQSATPKCRMPSSAHEAFNCSSCFYLAIHRQLTELTLQQFESADLNTVFHERQKIDDTNCGGVTIILKQHHQQAR
ncbi:hypothetical protein HCN44_010202 [Aphidius gifuensis]|uniref:Uncharacterized protein n=1 Tax=Aphidius gifuensis TaxID=684658 RepID=A0A834XXS7_APHGI|nr:hypothetical protein HCN44_010202 [Aphidius gifuensis]